MKTIYIGAGHSDTDPGACAHKHTEAGIVTELRNLILNKLRQADVPYISDGEGTSNMPLKTAIALAKTAGPVRVELHCNAGPAEAKGVEALSMPVHKPLAQALAQAVAKTVNTVTRGEKGWKADDSGQHHRLGFCREGGGVILELFFISNASELSTYLTQKDRTATAIADVLIDFAGR